MILVETSAWIEYFRRTESPADVLLDRLIDGDEALATTEPVVMELLAGEPTDAGRDEVRALLARYQLLPVEGIQDWTVAAEIYRACRAGGHTLSTQIDCLIAAVAIRSGASLLHLAADFDFIAQHTPLAVYRG